AMTGDKLGGDKKVTEVVAKNPEDRKGLLKHIGVARSEDWDQVLAYRDVGTVSDQHSEQVTRDRQRAAIICGLMGMGPRDELIRTPSDTATTQRTPLLKDAVWLP